jgi:putative restriction endonuclease
MPLCPFCYDNIKDRVVAERNSVVAIQDNYPVSAGHLLIVPKRHIADYFSMNDTEKKDTDVLIMKLADGVSSLSSRKWCRRKIQKILLILSKVWGGSEDSDKKQKIRDQGFRKVIVRIYDHRCALCGIRMLTPEGHTIVEAAHIKPWHKSYDDRPINGLALCRLCHRSFDEGLMSVGKNYEVLVSRRVRTDRNIPGHMMTLTDRPIFRPEDEVYWPGLENIEWHQKHTFK